MIDYKKGIVNRGNWYRLQKVMQKAGNGENICIGFLGGSITQGSLASTPEKCYAYLVYSWWQSHYRNLSYINAGIGGTTSQFGAARVKDDLLCKRPDVVFVEFSVNDSCDEHFQETYEGLVRRIYREGITVVLVHNVQYDSMQSAEKVHLAVGKHYQLPCVSMKSTIYPLVASGEIPNRQITPDDLHPNDEGHAMVASVITYLLDRVRSADSIDPMPDRYPAPMTDNQYESSVRYQNYNSNPELHGFVPDYTPQEHITQMFRKGFTAQNNGDQIIFQVKGTGVAVQYRKSVRKPAPIAKVVVDDNEDNAILLDANFQEEWGDCLYLDTVLEHGENKVHNVCISIVEAHENDVVPFYLVSVIGSQEM